MAVLVLGGAWLISAAQRLSWRLLTSSFSLTWQWYVLAFGALGAGLLGAAWLLIRRGGADSPEPKRGAVLSLACVALGWSVMATWLGSLEPGPIAGLTYDLVVAAAAPLPVVALVAYATQRRREGRGGPPLPMASICSITALSCALGTLIHATQWSSWLHHDHRSLESMLAAGAGALLLAVAAAIGLNSRGAGASRALGYAFGAIAGGLGAALMILTGPPDYVMDLHRDTGQLYSTGPFRAVIPLTLTAWCLVGWFEDGKRPPLEPAGS